MQLTPNHKMQIKYTSHSSQDHITHIQTEQFYTIKHNLPNFKTVKSI